MTALLLAAALATATPAPACTSPFPRAASPAAQERSGEAAIAKDLFLQSAEIVYGTVIRHSEARGGARFKVLRVYKGTLRPGTILTVERVPPMPCAPSHAPAANGTTGVIGYSGAPKLDFIEQKWVDRMIAAGWIKRARR